MVDAKAMEMLEVRDLHAHYGESHILQGVSLSVYRGELVTLIGRNGSGRTTILRSVLGLVGRRSGSVRIMGAETIHLPPHRIARLGVGYCPEERGIFSRLSVEENLVLPPVVKEGGMGIDRIYEIFPNLYEHRKAMGTRLSGGEQQMLALARILRTGAKLLLLDEITEGLAPVIVQALKRLIAQLKELGFTVVLVEQNFHFASELADRHYVVDRGHIAEMIPKEALKESKEKINAYLGV
jgi:branched-chain amino acid transport system ATP-binding protein